jgi:hypothetical protein
MRRFDAKRTHLEERGTGDRADDRKRITGPDLGLSCLHRGLHRDKKVAGEKISE